MKMFRKSMIAIAAASAVLAMTAAAAEAASTYTPTGTTVDFVGSGVSFRDIEANQTWTCGDQFGMSGSVLHSGASRVYGAAAGALPAVTPSGCTHVIFGPTTVTPAEGWSMSATGDATGTTGPARLDNVSMSFSAMNCDFTIAGVVDGTFDSATQKFTPVIGASGLTLTSVPPGQAICATLDLLEGDTVEVGGSWTNVGPALNFTNP